MNSKRIILEDILDDLSAQDIARQSKDVVIELDKFDAYLLFAAEQQKCGFLQGRLRWQEYGKDTEIDIQHKYLREHAVNYYKKVFYTVETTMNVCSFIDEYKISFCTFRNDDFGFSSDCIEKQWSAEEFVSKDKDGRFPCCAIWEDVDYYYTVHDAIRIDFKFNPNVSIQRFVRDMNLIYKNIFSSFIARYFYIKRDDPQAENGSIDIMKNGNFDDNKRFIAAYELLTGENVQYWNDDNLLDKYKKNYRGCSLFVQYLIAFLRYNALDPNSKYIFEVRGICAEKNNKWENAYSLMLYVVPKYTKEPFNREELYEFLMENIVKKLQIYNNKHFQEVVELFICDGGSYIEGLRNNPETIASNIKIGREMNRVDVYFLNPADEIYPCGRKKVFHKLKNASYWRMQWKRILSHNMFL